MVYFVGVIIKIRALGRHPSKQGLKPKNGFSVIDRNPALGRHPSKQGLKHILTTIEILMLTGSRPTSIKTRIETIL